MRKTGTIRRKGSKWGESTKQRQSRVQTAAIQLATAYAPLVVPLTFIVPMLLTIPTVSAQLLPSAAFSKTLDAIIRTLC